MSKTLTPLYLHLRQSHLLFHYQHLLHAGVMVYCLAASLLIPIMALAVVVVLVSWGHLTIRSRTTAGFGQTVTWHSTGAWVIKRNGCDPRSFRQLDCWYSHHRLTILGFKMGLFRREYVLVLADNCDPEAWRRLRVRLRQGAAR